MTSQHLNKISDRDLLDAVMRAAGTEREATVELLGLLGEVDARRLYLSEGCASLFTYCTQVLHLSEHAAYHRIEGARVARQFPRILELLSSGALTLTTVALLRPVLTTANAIEVIDAAVFKSKREVEVLVARLAPKPDVPTTVRRVPAVDAQPLSCDVARAVALSSAEPSASATSTAPATSAASVAPRTCLAMPRALAAPLSPDRFLLRLTISADTHAKLRRAQDLLRHSIPSGAPAAVIERALTMLVDHLERAKAVKVNRPRPGDTRPTAECGQSRRIPRAVKRAVWKRDEGRCTFSGRHGRCSETAWLEFHHILAFARGGPTDMVNLTLRCRAHNQFDALREFGPRPARPREASASLPL